MTPIKTLHVSSGNLYGGIETMLQGLARHRGVCPAIDPRFALCFEGRIADELQASGVATEILGAVRIRQPWTVLMARRALKRLLRRDRPDVVICHGSWPHAVFAPTVRREGLPLAYWQHDAEGRREFHDKIGTWTPPDLVIANSHFTAGTSTRRFLSAPVEVIYCPVSAPNPPTHLAALRTEVRRELQTPDDSTVIVTTCRLEPYKGHTLLLDALGRLRDQPGWEAWIAGGIQRPHEREFLDELRRRAEVAGVADRVRFLGQRSDVPKLLAAADIHCQPNLGPEPFGIAFIEAMYAGLPIVTTGIGGALEIVTEACGILVPPDDPAALADILAGLLADPSRRAALGSCGPSRARQLCDPAVILERLAEILKRLRVSQNSLSQ